MPAQAKEAEMEQQEKERRVARLRGSRAWTEDEARLVVEACEGSGETVSRFAERMSLVPQRIWWWRKRLRRLAPSRPEVATFLPLVVRAAPRSETGEPAAVLQVGAARLGVRELTPESAAWIAAVIRGLQETAP